MSILEVDFLNGDARVRVHLNHAATLSLIMMLHQLGLRDKFLQKFSENSIFHEKTCVCVYPYVCV